VRPTTRIVVAACAVSAGVHAGLVPQHLREAPSTGIAFVVATGLLLATFTALAMRPESRRTARGAALLLAGLIAFCSACPCHRASGGTRRSSSRSAAADGEDWSMAQTDQAWDWGVELRDEERSELELLRSTVAQLRTELDQAHEALRSCRERHQDASQALRQLAEARPWRRRRVRRALRERQLV
jgi:hypothetical protein